MPDDPAMSHVGADDVDVVGMKVEVIHSDGQQSTVQRLTEEGGISFGLLYESVVQKRGKNWRQNCVGNAEIDEFLGSNIETCVRRAPVAFRRRQARANRKPFFE